MCSHAMSQPKNINKYSKKIPHEKHSKHRTPKKYVDQSDATLYAF